MGNVSMVSMMVSRSVVRIYQDAQPVLCAQDADVDVRRSLRQGR